jgi:superfamily II DNA or RNA helicase
VARLEELARGASIRGVLPDHIVSIIDVKWYGNTVVEVTYKDSTGRLASELIYRDREPALEIVTQGSPWSFDGDGGAFRLAAEAYRIRMAYLFDPVLAVHTSLVDPLPHQIIAVYGDMLTRQPLRFLLADDPGAGKTIMTGLLIKELIVRGDLARCLIVCPSALVEQWQDEMDRKFQLPFNILTNDQVEAARTGNWFLENPLAICRLDKLSRDENVQAKLQQTEWDLIVCDEAHKMSASYFGGEVSYTKRYRLGQMLSELTRHFLLLTATPHNGKEADFQLFMALLDSDRFEGKYREGVHSTDVSDLMRRMVKEELVKFDGRPLFPERIAYTVNYRLSDAERRLYTEVTDYVTAEFSRADNLDEGRKGTVGFALTTLQRRLASSPAAIHESLRRRRERLEKRLREEKSSRTALDLMVVRDNLPDLTETDLEDLEDATSEEIEALENQVVDQASAARTIAELETEIASLKRLEKLAEQVRQSGTDRKWDELSKLLQDQPEMFDAAGHRRKLILFTEHRDTLDYLAERIGALLGKPEAVVTIEGGMTRENRARAQQAFTQDKGVQVLVATDAAGEGVNLQRAHLMVNYDLPWNPNRIEQRFGRIHRIGQTEVCHLWNVVANETREGQVYETLLKKLERERSALGGRVFDVLGKLTFNDRPLRELLIEAVRYGDRPDVRARLQQVVDQALDQDKLKALLEERALAHNTLNAAQVQHIREQMERAEARRLQPHFIASFFIEAFKSLGGSIREREAKRYEITHVPASVRNRDRRIGRGLAVLQRYERITFEKDLITVAGKPAAEFVCPGHPLLDAVIDLILERNRDLLKRGAVLVDESDAGESPRALVFIEHAIKDALRLAGRTDDHIISREMQFVELDTQRCARNAGPAPYLDYRPPTDEERGLIDHVPEQLAWLRGELESVAAEYAITDLVPQHLERVRDRKEYLVGKTLQAVKDRLTKEINYWDHRAQELKAQELAGKTPKLNSARASQRADELARRLEKRTEELQLEKQVSALPPLAAGGALIVPLGLLRKLAAERAGASAALAEDETARDRVEQRAMDAVMNAERALGYEPADVSAERRGYDIESRVPGTGALRFIEVKGRVTGAATVTITKNEILTGLNKPDEFILALVEVDGQDARPRYVRRPFRREPDFGVTSVNYDLDELLALASEPF